MTDARTIYAASALRSLPRLLSLLDRNPLSPTYGCLHRDYWLYKTSDFPDAVRQFGTHALALAYAHDLPGNVYRGNANVRAWAIAGLKFWASIQHADGSFDEFYPFERGWVGPTAFTTYAAADSYRLIFGTHASDDGLRPTAEVQDRVLAAIRRAAWFIARGETEEDHLANHHAMSVLAVHAAAELLNDDGLRQATRERFRAFLAYHHPEGWSREYDGADPGYLSATISFLAKVYDNLGTPRVIASEDFRTDLRDVLRPAVEFASYFVYPDGSYAGTLGSRNTLHFYPHGFELLAPELPMAAAIAERMAQGLAEGRLVPPQMMSDRYVHYRVPEYLLAAADAVPRPALLAQLPYERPPFTRVFPAAGVAAAVHGYRYTVANLAKGGVVKTFDRASGSLALGDTGWLGELTDGRIVASQWIAPAHRHQITDGRWTVTGSFYLIPPPKLFTPLTHIVFRALLVVTSWSPPLAHRLKGQIRRTLIFGSAAVPCRFHRMISFSGDALSITDTIENTGRLAFRRVLLGGEIPVRYVPQSRFFQPHELEIRSTELTPDQLAQVNRGAPLTIARAVPVTSRVQSLEPLSKLSC